MTEKKRVSEMTETEKAQLLSEVQNTMSNDLTNMLEQLKDAEDLIVKLRKRIEECDFASKEKKQDISREVYTYYQIYELEKEIKSLNEAIEAATKAATAVNTYEDYLPHARDVIYALSDIPGVIENYEGESEDRWQLYGKGFLDGQISMAKILTHKKK